MKANYGRAMIELLQKAEIVNEKSIEVLAQAMANKVINDKLIHLFGTGHSHIVGIELFARAGGLGNMDAMLDPLTLTNQGAQRAGKIEQTCGLADMVYDDYCMNKDDMVIVVSNSGRNAMPIEMAKRCKAEGLFVAVVTSFAQYKDISSRHPSGKKLSDYADVIIDTCVPKGDYLVEIGPYKTGGASSIVSMFLLNSAMTRAIEICVEKDCRPLIFQSQNLDGITNQTIYDKFKNRIRHY